MNIQFANNAASKLAGNIASTDTSLSVRAGDGVLFPSISGSQYFTCTLVDLAGNLEIIKVTARSADVFTIERAQEGTSGRAFSVGDVISHRFTAGSLDDVMGAVDNFPTPVDTEFIGAYDSGSGVYSSLSDSEFRTALGSTTVGDAVFIASDEAAAQTALGLVPGTDVLAPNGDASSLTNVPGDVITTRGDIIVGDSSGNPSRLSAGSAGTINYYDSNGDIQRITAGTDGQIITYASGIPVAGDVSGGYWSLVDTQTANSSSNEIIFSGLNGAQYDYQIRATGVRPATDAATITMRIGYSTGPTWLGANYIVGDGNTISGSGSTAFNIFGATLSNAVTELSRVTVTISSFGDGTVAWPHVQCEGMAITNASSITDCHIVGAINNHNVITAFRLFTSAGNIAEGTFELYRHAR